MELSALVTTDSREPLQKLRRSALQKICKDNDIKFDPSGPAERLRQLIEGSGADYMKKDFFQKMSVPTEDGGEKTVVVPVVKPHATANKDINYDAILEARAKAQEKTDENTELKERLAKMEEMLANVMNKGTQEGATNGLKALAEKSIEEQYFEAFGKKPHHKMKPETMQAQIDAKS